MCMKVKLRMRNQLKGKGSQRVRYETERLKDEGTRKAFTVALKNRYEM